MATAADLINDAARANGKLGPGRTLSTVEQTDALRIFRRMVDAWSIERLMIADIRRDTYTLTPSLSPHTIGPGGDFDAARPVRIERMGLVLTGGSEIPIELLTDQQWAELSVKELESNLPTKCHYSATVPLGELHFWPVPLEACDVALYTWSQLTAPPALDSEIVFPPGYEQAIVDNLAVLTCPLFGRQITPMLLEAANKGKARLKGFNAKSPRIASSDYGMAQNRRGSFNYHSGQ